MDKPINSLLTIEELSSLSGVSVRTIRFYVKEGILDKPEGKTKNARYDAHHLEELENISKLKQDGFTLDRIRKLKIQTETRLSYKRALGAPVTKHEIEIDEGVSIVFVEGICNLDEQKRLTIAKILSKVYVDNKNS